MTAGRLGCIVTPAQGNRIPPRARWCADNNCGPGKGGIAASWPGARAYDQWLAGYAPDAELMSRCLFAVAPDVVGDARATARRFNAWAPRLRKHGYPVALAAQDGLEHLVVPWDDLDVLFIGGTTEWKLGPAAAGLIREARRRGKGAHAGRVNSARRYAHMQLAGCTSADGTYVSFGPDMNLPKALAWGEDLLSLLDGEATA